MLPEMEGETFVMILLLIREVFAREAAPIIVVQERLITPKRKIADITIAAAPLLMVPPVMQMLPMHAWEILHPEVSVQQLPVIPAKEISAGKKQDVLGAEVFKVAPALLKTEPFVKQILSSPAWELTVRGANVLQTQTRHVITQLQNTKAVAAKENSAPPKLLPVIDTKI